MGDKGGGWGKWAGGTCFLLPVKIIYIVSGRWHDMMWTEQSYVFNNFTTNYRRQIVISFNMESLLKLINFLPISNC